MNKLKVLLFIISILLITGCGKKELMEYSTSFNYFDSDINIKLYTTSFSKANSVFDEIERLFSTYESITNRDNKDSEVSYIFNNNSKDKKIKISDSMNSLIEYGIKLYNDSDGFLSINTGDIVDLWNKYDDIPSNKELNSIDTRIDNIIVNDNILDNNHVNLEFKQFIKGFIINKVKEYLDEVNIDTYFISTGNEVLAGKGVDNEDYVVAITSPFNNEVLKVFNLQNKYITTKSIYHNSYNYDGKIYSSLVDAKSKMMTNKMVSVTVIGEDVYTTELASNLLFMNDYNNGVDIAMKYNVNVIWCFYDQFGNEVIENNID